MREEPIDLTSDPVVIEMTLRLMEAVAYNIFFAHPNLAHILNCFECMGIQSLHAADTVVNLFHSSGIISDHFRRRIVGRCGRDPEGGNILLDRIIVIFHFSLMSEAEFQDMMSSGKFRGEDINSPKAGGENYMAMVINPDKPIEA